VLRLSQRSKERLKTTSSCSKKRERNKRELCSVHQKGFAHQQVSVGAIGVHPSISYILFLHFCASFHLYSAT
jgi:hypothetical protein